MEFKIIIVLLCKPAEGNGDELKSLKLKFFLTHNQIHQIFAENI